MACFGAFWMLFCRLQYLRVNSRNSGSILGTHALHELKGQNIRGPEPLGHHKFGAYGALACIDPEVKRSKVKITRLRKLSQSHGC